MQSQQQIIYLWLMVDASVVIQVWMSATMHGKYK